ncbi:cocaine esterase-like protein [Lates japonicus]|uniref:Cocaine esterase-like protein n=1 Tax=Lates japonicus TaxID=270547 RepID=A0AAD3MHC8_LATJO|nr:cocaine esterase-like protein [Lates japonicus]
MESQHTERLCKFLAPSIGDTFLNGPPENILKNKEFQKVPTLIGVSSHEFGWTVPQASGENELILNEYLQQIDSREHGDTLTEILCRPLNGPGLEEWPP